MVQAAGVRPVDRRSLWPSFTFERAFIEFSASCRSWFLWNHILLLNMHFWAMIFQRARELFDSEISPWFEAITPSSGSSSLPFSLLFLFWIIVPFVVTWWFRYNHKSRSGSSIVLALGHRSALRWRTTVYIRRIIVNTVVWNGRSSLLSYLRHIWHEFSCLSLNENDSWILVVD